MSIFSRPNLDNFQFKQLSGTTLTLSGLTQINNVSGLSINNGSGAYVPIILTGATNGDNLVYRNGIVSLESSPTGATYFDSCRPTTRNGIPVVDVSGSTVQEFLDGYFFPPVSLSTSLSVATGYDASNSVSPSCRQMGDCSVGNLCWNAIKNTNPITDIYASTDGSGTYNCTILSGGNLTNNSGGTISYTYSFSCATPSTGTTKSTVNYSLSGITSAGESSSSTASIVWYNKRFNFINSTYYSNSSISTVLSGLTGQLSTLKAMSLTVTLNNEFFYYVYPKSWGTATYVVNGLGDNAWGNESNGTLFSIDYTNTNGYTNGYYVARSDNRLTGIYNIIIS